MRNEVLSSVFDPDNVEFYYENDQLDMDAVIRAYRDTPFTPSTFNAFEMGSKAEIPILINEEQDRKNITSSTSSNNSTLRENNPTPWVDDQSAIWNKKWECSRLCFQKIVWIIYVFCYCVSIFL